ncbi:MAG: hypothetical protein SH808_09065 [Saprospiraceae bacterium]|nr:hypothetical protein [Saprospiraceae bacterium]
MEENKPNIKPAPGLAEAIHPEIGNGVVWAQHIHEQLLRSPDSSKQLDHLLILDHLQLTNSQETVETSISEIHETPTHEIVLKETESPDQRLKNNSFGSATSHQQEEAGVMAPLEGKKKGKVKKEGKVKQKESPESFKDVSDEEKMPKAGKLVRKAAKSVTRQEKEQNKVLEKKTTQQEMELSPYTRWLKSFAGSDYVHPYEDDFAFAQGSGLTGEGISETFADLLSAQGYKEQAIEMYIKLMEKYPEKSGFFAAKIEALQQ